MDSEENHQSISWNCWLHMILAGAGPLISIMIVAMDRAQSSVLIYQLRRKENFIHVTPDEETWIASLGIVMAPISALFIGPFVDTFGRKKGLQLFFLVSGSGFAVLAFARELRHIYIGRTIISLGVGIRACSLVYLVEVSTKAQREYLLSVVPAVISGGVTLMCIVGGYLPWQIASLIFSIIAFVLFFLQCFAPESPPWLYKTGKQEAAVRNYETLGRIKSDIQQELDTLQLECKNKQEKLKIELFLEPTVWKPFFIMATFIFLKNASGIADFDFYRVDFIERLGTNYNPLNVTVLLAIGRLLAGSTFVIFFQMKFGRKFAAAFSALCMAVAFLGLGAYEYVYRDVIISERPAQCLVLVLILIYTTSSLLGMLNLPSVMTAEVFPLRVRGTMTGVLTVIDYVWTFFFAKTYHVCVDALQMSGLLFAFAGFSLVAIPFAIFVLPETKNKSLYEIQQSFLVKINKPLLAHKNVKYTQIKC